MANSSSLSSILHVFKNYIVQETLWLDLMVDFAFLPLLSLVAQRFGNPML
jgi:hypothetical protein